MKDMQKDEIGKEEQHSGANAGLQPCVCAP